jgi:polar amino acid transport system substrate-binding protein
MNIGKAPAVRPILVAIVLLSWVWRGGQAAAETVRIAYPEVYPPITELKDGKAEGLAVDIVGAAAKRVGIEIEFVPVPFEQVQRTLEDGRAEAIFPLAITRERLPMFDFSDPFLVTGGALFVRAPSATPEGLGSQVRSWLPHELVRSPHSFRKMHPM